MKFTVSMTNRTGLYVNLRKVNRATVREVAKAINVNRRRALTYAKSIVPVDTGTTKRSLTTRVSPQELTFTLLYDPQVYENEGKEYYAVYVELGTSRWGGFPTLFYTMEYISPKVRADVRSALRRGVR